MAISVSTPEEIVQSAVLIAGAGEAALFNVLDDLTVPLYITDESGLIVYFNPACIAFAGRTPTLQADRWCVTWKLYTAQGETLPHDQCPMAVAITEQRPIRNVWAIAERPDGSRVPFAPYPTPILRKGELKGAVNVLVDISEIDEARKLRDQAGRCRRLAFGLSDRKVSESLRQLAAEYEAQAALIVAHHEGRSVH